MGSEQSLNNAKTLADFFILLFDLSVVAVVSEQWIVVPDFGVASEILPRLCV